jgi:Na+/H+-dicarboxylate symporter
MGTLTWALKEVDSVGLHRQSDIRVCQREHLYESLNVCVSCPVYIAVPLIICHFIMGVCQREHLYERLKVCVSCPVYIAVPLIICHFIMGVCQREHLYER